MGRGGRDEGGTRGRRGAGGGLVVAEGGTERKEGEDRGVEERKDREWAGGLVRDGVWERREGDGGWQCGEEEWLRGLGLGRSGEAEMAQEEGDRSGRRLDVIEWKRGLDMRREGGSDTGGG
eukprot:jgi/Undpi1/1610/HiC_scaffold_11.g05000.m1